MAKLRFDDLSTDLKALVIDKVTRPTDLKNLCLVNKQMHSLAVKTLYANVALDLGSAHDSRLSAFLNPRNIGLQHVRQLRLDLATVRGSCNQEQQAHVVTRMILEFLPENILEEFSWCPWRPFSAENMLLLYKRQRRLKWLEVMDLTRDLLPDLKKDESLTKSIFTEGRKLAIYPENRTTLRLSQFFVERMAEKLEELIIHANFHDSLDTRDRSPHRGEIIEPRELNDSATAPGLLSRTVFEHMLPFEKCKPFDKLTSLRLHRVSLRYCADTWCRLIDFTKLQELRLYHCTGADSLFGQLSKADNLPKKLRVLEVQHKDNAENEALLALDGFLCLVTGLRDLVIDMEHVMTLPAVAGITRHAKTLELLSVHGSLINPPSRADEDPDEHVYDWDEFDKLCNACSKIEQLSCAWPATSLLRMPNLNWKAFECSVATLKRLVTLHISTWPSSKPGTSALPRPVFETLLQGLAQRIFEITAGKNKPFASATTVGTDLATGSNITIIPLPSPVVLPQHSSFHGAATSSTTTTTPPSTQTTTSHPGPGKLSLIAFGISDKIFEREDSKNQILYLRSTAQDAEGRPVIYAAPIGWCLRQYIEPRSEVLDFILHREARPPFREVVADTTNPLSDWGLPGVNDDASEM